MNTEEVAKQIANIREMQVIYNNMMDLYVWDNTALNDVLHVAQKNIQEAMLHASARVLEETRK